MNIEKIPNIFWYSISACIVLLTLNICFMSFRSKNLSINSDFFGIRINNFEEMVSSQERIIEAKEKEIERLKELLEVAKVTPSDPKINVEFDIENYMKDIEFEKSKLENYMEKEEELRMKQQTFQ